MQIITTVVAHIDHGKTTLIDSLLAYTKTISLESAGELRYLDSRADELYRGITLKLSAICINHQYYFLDTPGHIDFHYSIINSNYLSDVSLLIIDINEGITPRLYSLISNKPIILFINKIDKIINLELENIIFRIEEVICNVQALIKNKYSFDWTKNNIILGSSKYCFGINSNNFGRFKSKSTIKSVIYFLKQIFYRIEEDKDFQLFKEYCIKEVSIKGVLSVIFPLTQCVLYSINEVYRKEYIFEYINSVLEAPISVTETSIKNNNSSDNEYLDSKRIFNEIINYNASSSIVKYFGFTTYSIKFNDMTLFITRTIFGKISKNDFLFSINNECRKVKVNSIYKFINDKLIECDYTENNALVALEGDFIQLSTLIAIKDTNPPNIIKYSNLLPHINFDTPKLPYYSKLLILNNLNELELFKLIFKELKKTEFAIKIILNKFNEFEILTQGKVHLEKVLFDLDELYSRNSLTYNEIKELNFGKGYYLLDSPGDFAECVGQPIRKSIIDTNELNLIGELSNANELPSTNELNLIGELFNANEFNNYIEFIPLDTPEIQIECNSEFIESVLIDFINCSSLIQERLLFTKIKYFSAEKDYNKAKSVLKSIYSLTNPFIISLHIKLNLEVPFNYLSNTYKIINLYLGICKSTELINFYHLEIELPSIYYNEFVEKMNVSAQGTVFIQPQGYVYLKREGVFDKFIGQLRKEKGMDIGILGD